MKISKNVPGYQIRMRYMGDYEHDKNNNMIDPTAIMITVQSENPELYNIYATSRIPTENDPTRIKIYITEPDATIGIITKEDIPLLINNLNKAKDAMQIIQEMFDKHFT